MQFLLINLLDDAVSMVDVNVSAKCWWFDADRGNPKHLKDYLSHCHFFRHIGNSDKEYFKCKHS
jgi:hypothetical protein